MIIVINYINDIINHMHKKERHFYAGLLNWFHLFIDIFIFSYLFIFPVYYDFYLIWFIFFQALHWLALHLFSFKTPINKGLKYILV